MLSRRNVRIKVMQTLFSFSPKFKEEADGLEKMYNELVNSAYRMYLYELSFLVKVCEYARQDQNNKSKKFLPNEDDLVSRTKLFENSVTQAIVKNHRFNALLLTYKIPNMIDSDIVRESYKVFASTEPYKEYLKNNTEGDTEHVEILVQLYKHLSKSDLFRDHIEEVFAIWYEDESVVTGAIKRTLKSLPHNENFTEDHFPSKEVTETFGKELLWRTYRENTYFEEIIEPVLKNWDIERITSVDIVLIKMAMSEMLFFQTIPVNATLNEFVELAKIYSTVKSQEFVNGVLHAIMKKFEAEGKLEKIAWKS